MLAALVENGEIDNPGTDYFVKKYLDLLVAQSPDIDAVILGCTHYPLLLDSFRKACPSGISFIPQNEIVALSLSDYLHRHPEMDARLSKKGTTQYFTTDNPEVFDGAASLFLGRDVRSRHIDL